MHAVGPTSEHRGLSIFAAVAVARVFKHFEVGGLLRRRGVEVFRDTGAQTQFAALRIVHLDAHGAQRTIVATHVIDLRHIIVIASGSDHGIFIRTIDEALVGPVAAPRVDKNPGSHLVFVFFSDNSVAVEVKLNAVVIANEGQLVVERIAPSGHVFLAGDTQLIVLQGSGNFTHGHLTGHIDVTNAASGIVGIAAVVPKPLLHGFTTFFGLHALRKEGVALQAVEHG